MNFYLKILNHTIARDTFDQNNQVSLNTPLQTNLGFNRIS